MEPVQNNEQQSQQPQGEKKPEQQPQQQGEKKPQQEKKQQQQKKQDGGGKKDKPKGKAAIQQVSLPPWFEDRLKLFDEYKAKSDEAIKNMPDEPIKVTLPDGKVVDGLKFKTTPYEIAKGISRGLADNVVVAKVDGAYHDLHRPIEKDCTMQLFKFDSEEGKHCFWHSSAHVLGQALEVKYGAHLTIGPPVDDGFYYDVDLPAVPAEKEGEKDEKPTIRPEDLEALENLSNSIVKEKQPFIRVAVPRDVALKIFEYNKFKQEVISKIPATEEVSLYRCGPLIDLCRGPHLPNTSYIKAFKVTKNSGAYWMGKAENELLQRVYGIAFPEKKQLAEWEEFQREAAKRDHRKIGQEQQLFFFHHYTPGCAFILPHGARIYNKLISFIKNEYHFRGFTEVMTPQIFNKALWETSGHWQNYKENMFILPNVDNTEYAAKAMNCPSHCLIFDHTRRSYRELPLRLADFGVLHRNELAGALVGLTRVRKFCQDDAHIFCTAEQVGAEVKGALDFMQHVYGIFGFGFELGLSTRPEKFLGEVSVWDEAEKVMAKALDEFGRPWKVNPGDGAFYGPKIDILVLDALKRQHQCATIQLDFQLPLRFNLSYTNEHGELKTPVIIHRAILGSVERMLAILIEHTAGKWPYWISPRQCVIVTVSEKFHDYALEVHKKIHAAGHFVDCDLSDKTLPKKIREAQLAQYNFIIVVGEEESKKGTINIRTRDNVQHGEKTVDELLVELAALCKEYK